MRPPEAWHPFVRTWELMGTVVSAQVVRRVGLPADRAGLEAAVTRAFDRLAADEARFSTFRSDSEVSRIRRGELRLADAHADVVEVADRCAALGVASAGRFSAWLDGRFDPTGFVKGWAVERALRRELVPLLGHDGVEAVGLGAGGDLALRTAAGSEWRWTVGIADPDGAHRLLARLRLRDGAVATSGTAERGAHILDPATGEPAHGVRSATVVADDLADADAWATVAVVAGADEPDWMTRAGIRSCLLRADDRRVRRWAGGVELVAVEDALLPIR